MSVTSFVSPVRLSDALMCRIHVFPKSGRHPNYFFNVQLLEHWNDRIIGYLLSGRFGLKYSKSYCCLESYNRPSAGASRDI